ncbi:MAG: DUF4352 domain-containing protein [Chloroflexi bacterium]|nr:MAG: DUF4352 domain-containing protein [Chloroflexota bacterium]
MNKQRVLFFVIIGTAVLFIIGGSLVMQIMQPPDLNATATAVAIRSTEVAIRVTEAALQGTVTPSSFVSGVLAGEQTMNGLRIEVIDVDWDAWPLIQATNQFNDPPLPGKRMVLVTLNVSLISGEEPVQVDTSDFRMVGSRGEIYTTFDEETRCGVIPDALDGVVTPTRSMSGTVCVQVPEDEGDLALIYDPFVGDIPSTMIPLPSQE